MSCSPVRIGCCAAFMLVLLRVGIGWHFLHEGLWKYEHPSFSAEGFLRQSRGPFAEHFYALIPDYEGHQRLDAQQMIDRWKAYLDQYATFYNFSDEQTAEAGKILAQREQQLQAFLAEEKEQIEEYFAALDAQNLKAQQPVVQEVPYEQQRFYKKQSELKARAGSWLAEVNAIDDSFRQDLDSLLEDDQRARGKPAQTRTSLDWIDLATTYGLIAIGVCLIAGLFTRLACLGGVVFLAGVILSQPALPGIYPPPHPSAGHSLVVNKEFIEMLALAALMFTPVGRWGGLDFILYNTIFRRFRSDKE